MAPSMPLTADPFLAALQAAMPGPQVWAAPVVIAVSGGADSLALLLGLARLAAEPNVSGRLIVAHAEHDLRPEAEADRDFVAACAADLQVPFVSRRLAVRLPDGVRGEGVEARARRLRYRFLADVAGEAGARHVAVAHTADDQAETVLHRALRGTGLSGLAGMAAARELCEGIVIIRPLLGVSRRTVHEWLVESGATWREDASNHDTRLARNFLRHEILARCGDGPYPAATAALVRLGEHAARASAAIASAAGHLLAAHASCDGTGAVVLSAAPFTGLDPHLVAEVIRAVWQREGWPQRDMTARHYRSLAELVRSLAEPAAASAADGPVGAIDCPGGIRARPGPRQTLVLGPAQVVISTRR